MRDEFEDKIKAMIKYNKEAFVVADQRMDTIEESVRKEISDRVVETDEQIYVVRNNLSGK